MTVLLFILLAPIILPFAIIIELLKQPKYGLVEKKRRRR